MAENYSRHPNSECLVCHKQVYIRPSQLLHNKGRVYCSKECYGISCRKEKPCLVCGKPILARFNKKTCSRRCSNIHRTGIRYKLNRPKSKVKTQRLLKIRLLRLRGVTCERCNYNKVEILQVHHRDRNRYNNELDNLEILCPNCHYEEHFLKKSWLKQVVH